MNILTGFGIGAKIACGYGASRIATYAIKTVMPEATNIGIKICQELGVVAMSGVVVTAVGDYIDRTIINLTEAGKQIKNSIKNAKKEVEE